MKKYPISKTLRKQCEYDPHYFFPLTNPAKSVYLNLIGETGNNDKSNLSYHFYTIDKEIWCRFGTFDHTPTLHNPQLTKHLLIGDVQLSIRDLKTMIFDLQKVLKSFEKDQK